MKYMKVWITSSKFEITIYKVRYWSTNQYRYLLYVRIWFCSYHFISGSLFGFIFICTHLHHVWIKDLKRKSWVSFPIHKTPATLEPPGRTAQCRNCRYKISVRINYHSSSVADIGVGGSAVLWQFVWLCTASVHK